MITLISFIRNVINFEPWTINYEDMHLTLSYRKFSDLKDFLIEKSVHDQTHDSDNILA